jgi:hypothetical protein
MPRFRLLQPHTFEIYALRPWTAGRGVPHTVYLEAGAIIDTAEMPPHFRPSPHMTPLDPEAEAMLRTVVTEIRERAGTTSPPTIGPMHHMPGGDLYRVPTDG